jgi:hypothetical protein
MVEGAGAWVEPAAPFLCAVSGGALAWRASSDFGHKKSPETCVSEPFLCLEKQGEA